jgi:hypothetical protein
MPSKTRKKMMNDSLNDKRFSRRLREYALLASTVPAAAAGADIIYMDGLSSGQLDISGPGVNATFTTSSWFQAGHSDSSNCGYFLLVWSWTSRYLGGDGGVGTYKAGQFIDGIPDGRTVNTFAGYSYIRYSCPSWACSSCSSDWNKNWVEFAGRFGGSDFIGFTVQDESGNPVNGWAEITQGWQGIKVLRLAYQDDGSPIAAGDTGVFNVPGQFDTVQSAVDAAEEGRVIRVAPGVYNEQIDFQGKAITIESTDGPEVTIIDGSGFAAGSVVTFANGEGLDSVLRGFTIANGTVGTRLQKGEPSAGGGIFVNDASPTIEACVIRDNGAEYGGGLFLRFGDALVRDCRFVQNTGFVDGGGVQVVRSNARLEECTFELNVSGRNGGGIQMFNGSPILTGCRFQSNTAVSNGSGVAWFPFEDDALIESCVVTRNSCTQEQGGAIAVITGPSSTGTLRLVSSAVCNNSPLNIDGEFVDLGGNDLCGCPGDFDGDGLVAGGDLSMLLAAWGACDGDDPCFEDIDGNGQVDGADLAALLAGWGLCP